MERLSPVEGRVVASLVEKQLLTPQAYPLTLNALVAACNQSTSRDPVTRLGEGEVERTLGALKSARLVRFVLPSHGRSVVRFRHVLDETFGLDAPQLAVLAVLELRGPQTAAELRARIERMAATDSVDHELALLADRPRPLVARLERRPGQKEERWTSLLSEQWSDVPGSGEIPPADAPGGGCGAVERSPGGATFDELRSEVVSLRSEVAELRAALEALQESLGG